jgi:DNA-binding NarL/FixJ family response regulator
MQKARHQYKQGRKKPEFTELETQVFKYLYKGREISAIALFIGMDESAVRRVAFSIREKTGIQNIEDKHECVEWFKSFKRPGPRQLDPRNATPTQLDCMELLAKGFSYVEIQVFMMFSSPQTVQNHISEGCKRAGIQRSEIPAYVLKMRPRLAKEKLVKISDDKRRNPSPMEDPAFS